MTKEIVIAIVTPLAVAALGWGALAFCELMAARAEADGVDDWQDLFWPRMLKRVSAARYERQKLDLMERKGED